LLIDGRIDRQYGKQIYHLATSQNTNPSFGNIAHDAAIIFVQAIDETEKLSHQNPPDLF